MKFLIEFFDFVKAEPFISTKTGFFNDAKTDYFNFGKLNILMLQKFLF